ncbi:hypothetical protein JCM10450v2_008249 [Rhodotorula kratochvilovae]
MATEPLPPQLQGYAPTSAEKQAYQFLFDKADTQQLGVLTGDLAVPFFSHSALPPLILGEVWQIADPDNNGFLSPDRFGVACRLIGHAQERNRNGPPEVKPEWVAKPGPLPTFKGYTIPAHLQQQASEAHAAPASPAPPTRQSSLAPPAPGAAGLTTISAADKANYTRIFAGANGGSMTGLLDGDKAREIWVKSQLPYDVLGQIWNLADTHSRGALDLTDFTIGMHLLHLVLDGSLASSALPTVLDPKLYAAAAGLPAPGAGGGVPSAAAQPQSPLRQASLPPPRPPPASSTDGWAITPAELAESNTWFESLDAQSGRKGVIDGEQAVAFFGQSGLPVDQLAKVWDLADAGNEGHLTRETFAVAMHLLKRALAAPSTPLPDSLPRELVPPSMRAPAQQQQQPTGPQRDLLDLLDDDAPATPVPALQPQSTGASLQRAVSPPAPRVLSPQTTGARAQTLSPQPTGQRTLSPQPTGGSSAYTLRGTVFPQSTGSGASAGAGAGAGFESNFAPAPTPQQQQTAPTFFDDNDDADFAASASALTAREGTLRREAGELEEKKDAAGKTRSELEAQVESSTKEVAALQARIDAAREAHAAELARVEELRARLAEAAGVKERAKAELIRAESDLSALRMEKSEVEGEVLRDKEEVRDLKRRVGIVEEEKRILREEVERAKKEQRQGKGLAAIARKQLAQGEADRAALEASLDAARAPLPIEVDAAAEAGVAATAPTAPQAQAAAIPLPQTPASAAALSPAASTRSLNPFDRFVSPQATGTGAGAGASPPVQTASKNPFAFAAAPAASPAPVQDVEQPRAVGSEQQPTQELEGAETSLPVAAAAAVGTGALAALGAAGAGIAHALGVGAHDEPAEEKEDAPKEEEPEADPFGVSTTAPATATEAVAGGFGDDFAVPPAAAADAFGDDFAAPSVVETNKDAGAGFDDEFAALDAAPAASTEEGVPAPVEGTLGALEPDAGFTDAVRDLNEGKGPDAVEGTLGEVEPDAGFDEAFREVEQAHAHPHEDKGKARAVEDEEEDVFGEGASVPAAALEDGADSDKEDADRASVSSSSDDDDDGPEEAFGAVPRPRSAGGSSVDAAADADASGFATPAATSADLGASTVSEIAALTGEAPPAQDADLGPTAELASRVDGSREPTTHSESGESFVHVNVGPTGTAESESMLEPPAPASFQPASPAPTPPAHARRAAPPPPQRSTPVAAPTPPEVPAFPPAAAVDNGFADAFAPAAAQDTPFVASPAAEQIPALSPEDDFDSAFADMGVSSPGASASAPAPPAAAAAFAAQPDFDSFDSDFNDFDAENAARTASDTAQVNAAVGATTDFDEAAFADFDSSFPAPAPASAPTASKDDDDAFAAFDDSFAVSPVAVSSDAGVPPLGRPLGTASSFDAEASGTAPLYASPPGPPPPLKDAAAPAPAQVAQPQGEDFSDDSDGVRLIRQMGFSKEQALEALEKYDGDVNRAVNSLVG